MQELDAKYRQGWALRIAWYEAQVPSPIMTVTLAGGDVTGIVEEHMPDAPEDVKAMVIAYSTPPITVPHASWPRSAPLSPHLNR